MKIPVGATDKDIEHINLEAHVIVSEERHRRLEERISRAEVEIDSLQDHLSNGKKVLIGGLFSIIAGLLVGAFSIATNYLTK